jgi:hypothetical protein
MAWNYSTPFATLNADHNELKLDIEVFIFRREYFIPKEKVLEVIDYDGIFSKGLLIRHRVETLPQTIIFWTRKRSELKQLLSEFGYAVN